MQCKGVPEEKLEALEWGARFNFACHPDVPCFTECCRNLRLLLTPYDVLRLRKALGLSSRSFIDEYTDLEFREPARFPVLYLRMKDDDERLCPFLKPEGCAVYEHRPSACRIYPVARATRFHGVHQTLIESFYVIREDHCRGFQESRSWTVEEWLEDQGLGRYLRFNDEWTRTVMHKSLSRGLSPAQQQFVYTLTYDLDVLRKMMESGKLDRVFIIDGAERERCLNDNEALLTFGLKWLRFSLLGESTLEVR
ncbi:YkgJ family cysteine cluster protein [Thermodesulforhabdus norvegica]|uniref:YkgJ family cysteine cluster protein n=1 Tax=Thermodesulforhabdus norvegica TaxID=39841 RepID=UPI0015A6C906|nr:YkgJ family cysteine cluster protein [Thermodesulforhabdus norvegica]